MADSEKLEKLGMFHGHVGPYVVIGLRLGEYALEVLGANSHFGIEAFVRCAGRTPESCLLDGIQFSTGCTLGKQNITHTVGAPIEARFRTRDTGKEVTLGLNEGKVREAVRRMHEDGEAAAVDYVRNLPADELIRTLRGVSPE